MNREDFIMLNKDIVYLDSASTSLKPKCVIDSMNDYYFNNTSNIHRGEYNEAILNNKLYDETKMEIAKFINCDKREVIYTSGCTSSINMFVLGYMKKYLKNGDVVLLSKSEHASNLLPWFNLSKEIGIIIKYIDLDSDYKLDYSSIDKLIKENNVKVISLAHITNVIGDIRDISYIGNICKKNNILFCVDAAQSIQHVKIDFKKYNISFLSFSSHKMMGPTGIGVLVGRYDLLEKMEPLFLGGDMNLDFESDCSYSFKEIPSRFEAGTMPIAEVIGLLNSIKYINNIGVLKIHSYIKELRDYLVSGLDKLDNIVVYNRNSDSGIVIFNVDKIFSQDVAIYLAHYNICVRAGNHCDKILKDELGVSNTVRVSLYLYNNKEDIDKLLNALKNIDKIYDIIL